MSRKIVISILYTCIKKKKKLDVMIILKHSVDLHEKHHVRTVDFTLKKSLLYHLQNFDQIR